MAQEQSYYQKCVDFFRFPERRVYCCYCGGLHFPQYCPELLEVPVEKED